MREAQGCGLDRLKGATAFVHYAGSTGSGYLVARQRIATCWHVVKDCISGDAGDAELGPARIPLKVRVLKVDQLADAAILGFDEDVDVEPLPVASGDLPVDVPWAAFGFPALANPQSRLATPGGGLQSPDGVPDAGTVCDPRNMTQSGGMCLLLKSDNASNGPGAELHGFSGAPVVVDGALVGHMRRIIGDADNKRRPSYGKVYATPIAAVLAILDVSVSIKQILSAPVDVDHDEVEAPRVYYAEALASIAVEEPMRAAAPTEMPKAALGEILAVLRAIDTSNGNNVDLVINGTNVHFERSTGEQRLQVIRAREADVRRRLSIEETGQNKLKESVARIRSASPPRVPQRQPVSGSWPTPNDPLYEAQELKRYEEALEVYRRDKELLPRMEADLAATHGKIDALKRDLYDVEVQIHDTQADVQRRINTARRRDVFQFLRRQLATSVAENRDALPGSAFRGLLRLTLAGELAAAAARDLNGEPDPGEDAIVAALKTEEDRLVRHESTSLGHYALSAWLGVYSANLRNLERLEELKSNLKERRTNGGAEAYVVALDAWNEQINKLVDVAPFDNLFEPEALIQVAQALDSREEGLKQASTTLTQLKTQAAEALNQGAAFLSRAKGIVQVMRDEASRLDRVLQLAEEVAYLARRSANPYATENASAFLLQLVAEGERRVGQPVAKLLEEVRSKQLSCKEATDAVESHSDQKLQNGLQGALQHLAAQMDQLAGSRTDLKAQPARIAKRKLDTLSRYGFLAIIPFLNVAGGQIVLSRLRKLEVMWASALPEYIAFRSDAYALCNRNGWIAAIAALVLLASYGTLYYLDPLTDLVHYSTVAAITTYAWTSAAFSRGSRLLGGRVVAMQ